MAYPTLTPTVGAAFRVRYATGYGKPVIAITERDPYNQSRDIAIFPATANGKREAERRRDEIQAQASREYAERFRSLTNGKAVS